MPSHPNLFQTQLLPPLSLTHLHPNGPSAQQIPPLSVPWKQLTLPLARAVAYSLVSKAGFSFAHSFLTFNCHFREPIVDAEDIG